VNITKRFVELLGGEVECHKETITSIRLYGTKTIDLDLEILRSLGRLEELVELDLANTGITDSGLVRLRKIESLRGLTLNNTGVTDDGLVHLQRLGNLDHLDLENLSVTNSGLVHLYAFQNLRFLNLSGTNVTEEGILRLKKALPKCDVDY